MIGDKCWNLEWWSTGGWYGLSQLCTFCGPLLVVTKVRRTKSGDGLLFLFHVATRKAETTAPEAGKKPPLVSRVSSTTINKEKTQGQYGVAHTPAYPWSTNASFQGGAYADRSD